MPSRQSKENKNKKNVFLEQRGYMLVINKINEGLKEAN
jgi:hypothetical protein